MPQKDLYEIDGELRVLSKAEARNAKPSVLLRIVRPTVGAEKPLQLQAHRANRELRPGDLVAVVAHRVPVYRGKAETLSTSRALEDALRLPGLDPALVSYLEDQLAAIEAPQPQEADDASTSSSEAQSATRRKRSKSRS